MPKIEVNEKAFFSLIGKKLDEDELIRILPGAKAELDDWDESEGILKIELNDTNRPDLWSTAGLARQVKILLGCGLPVYDFFSMKEDMKETGDRIIKVDPNLKDIRPYIAAFAAKGKPIEESFLIDIIQTQEKICGNYGQKRKSIAMGVYRADMIQYPVSYCAADPVKTSFVPLGFQRRMNLREILTDHPKGVEFGWIVHQFEKFPFLKDAKDDVLSFPPIINSATLGALEPGDSFLFIELTGIYIDTLLLAASIVACDFADFGYDILPVLVSYPYDTLYGREIPTPFYFQKNISLEVSFGAKLLGETITPDEAAASIAKAGNQVTTEKNTVILSPPPYRNDFLHPVDIVEEIMIGRGMDSFIPEMPGDYTIGRLSRAEVFSREVRDIMVGLGFTEMIYNYLGSRSDFIEKMNVPDSGFIHIQNPMTENYAMVRKSILPNLLASESVSANAVYPHKIFETGKVAFIDPAENYGSITKNYCAFLEANKDAGFNDMNAYVSAFFFYLSKTYLLKETEDPRFIPGRTALIYYTDQLVGILGEFHPSVLENWGIQMPCAGVEIDLDILLKAEGV
ncbi:MAG: phenylalanine--tRNA ligase subunit beta [Spirochaetales bacterium]|nr:phenylalanine--tRNA ligase subunit beta [Spirochaetales bacterium]